jgi:hypothetical protein
MDPRARAEALVRSTLALAEAPLRVALLREAMLATPTSELALALDLLCERAEQAEPRARECLISIVDALYGLDAEGREAVQRLREEAAGESLLALERLLRAPPSGGGPAGERASPSRPAGRLTADGREPKEERVPDYGKGRPLTLGERKSLARRPDRVMMGRLLLDPHPDVIGRLLANPKLTEDDVLRLASKRPNRPEVLSEIARSDRWMHRPRVRMAIVLNPSTPPEVSLPIVSLLMRQELKLVAESTAVPSGIRALCLEHLQRRPPVSLDDDDDAQLQ